MKHIKEYTVELALIRAIPDMTRDKIPASRTRSLYKKIQKLVDRELAYQPYVTPSDRIAIYDRILQFSDKVNWENRELDIAVLFNFVLGIIEDSEFKYPKKLIDIVSEAALWTTKDDIKDEQYFEAEKSLIAWNEIKSTYIK